MSYLNAEAGQLTKHTLNNLTAVTTHISWKRYIVVLYASKLLCEADYFTQSTWPYDPKLQQGQWQLCELVQAHGSDIIEDIKEFGWKVCNQCTMLSFCHTIWTAAVHTAGSGQPDEHAS